MHGCLSAVSIQNLHSTNNGQLKATHNPHKQHIRFLRRNAYRGPVLSLSSNPSFTRPSTPMPVTDEFSSLAINTAMTECFKGGLTSPSRRISWATSATCPRQSVVPRPRSLSLSSLSKVSEKGSKSCRNVDKQRTLIRINNQLWRGLSGYKIKYEVHHWWKNMTTKITKTKTTKIFTGNIYESENKTNLTLYKKLQPKKIHALEKLKT